jgi:hypothetical protein
MDLLAALRGLVEQAQVAQPPLWSLYLDLSEGPEEALRVAVGAAQAALRDPRATPALRAGVVEALGVLPGVLAAALGAGAPSVALFVGDGVRVEALRLPFAVSSRAGLGDALVLGPLLGSLEALEALICVSLSPGEARLYGVEGDQGRLLGRVRASRRGGLWEELSRSLSGWLLRRPSLVLALSGPPGLAREALEGLGEPWRGRVLGLVSPRVGPGEGGFVPALLAALSEAAPLPPRSLVDELAWRVLARGGEGAARGEVAVWGALSRGEARGVVFVEGASLRGWRCGACEAWGAGAAPPVCLSCGWEASPAPARAPGAALARARGGAVAEVWEEHPLAEALGVGALLAAAPPEEEEEP